MQNCVIQRIMEHIPCILQLDQLVDMNNEALVSVTTDETVYINGILVCPANKCKSRIFHKELCVAISVPINMQNQKANFSIPEFSSNGTLEISCICHHHVYSQVFSIMYIAPTQLVPNINVHDVLYNLYDGTVIHHHHHHHHALDSNNKNPLEQILASGNNIETLTSKETVENGMNALLQLPQQDEQVGVVLVAHLEEEENHDTFLANKY